mmetsp:Transcript_11310/g.12787  ORF Transcript_11310/g.12787 Transcript_11310/m.12787 type:complete len:93 (+) Transcript_11310:404-682(+)
MLITPSLLIFYKHIIAMLVNPINQELKVSDGEMKDVIDRTSHFLKIIQKMIELSSMDEAGRLEQEYYKQIVQISQGIYNQSTHFEHSSPEFI